MNALILRHGESLNFLLNYCWVFVQAAGVTVLHSLAQQMLRPDVHAARRAFDRVSAEIV